MSIDVQINLRIPKVKEAITGANGYPIDSASVRFLRVVRVPAVPKPGAILELNTTAGTILACEVVRADWSERDDRFIVYCIYAKRSLPPDVYQALVRDPEWIMRALV